MTDSEEAETYFSVGICLNKETTVVDVRALGVNNLSMTTHFQYFFYHIKYQCLR